MDCESSCAVVGSVFETEIEDEQEAFENRFKQYCEEIFILHDPEKYDVSSLVSMRAARKFAFIATAGEFATEYTLTQWLNGTSLNVAKSCYLAWLKYSDEIEIFKNK